MSLPDQNWFATYRGDSPRIVWIHRLKPNLAALAYCRESGQLFVAEADGGLYGLRRNGEIESLVRTSEPFQQLAWSDDGTRGFALSGEHALHWIRADLTIRATIELPEPSLGIACEAFGQYVAVSLSNGTTLLFDGPRQPIRHFTTTRPLTHLRFVATRPEIFAIADYGLVCHYDFHGELLWQTNSFSSVGDFCVTGNEGTLLVAGFSQGILKYDSSGDSTGSYQLGGTVYLVDASFSGSRIAAATQEQELFWLGATGQILWTGKLPEAPRFLACDPLGGGLICAFGSGGVARLEWPNPD